ncbi:HAD family hydrolase [Agreia sp.]|uniref:HAD family hydrolase n=1 Tax=Agreia sp. TaxID=1872416 RepID=UPI0035BBE98F
MTDAVAAPGASDQPAASDQPWLLAFDIDGTVLHEDGTLTDAVRDEVARVAGLGHEIMLATGRSVASTLPVLDQLSITPEYVVCSNGAITLKRDSTAPVGYRREFVEIFDPGPVLTKIRSHLAEASFAVEDEEGNFCYYGSFPVSVADVGSRAVPFEQLLDIEATRVVVISPDHDMEDFLALVERMGLHRVSYAIGWTAWLDIAPDGVNKATGLERVRDLLAIPRERVFAIGDGRNDIDMLTWAGEHGRGVAMGQAPDDVLAVASEVTASVHDDGLAVALRPF